MKPRKNFRDYSLKYGKGQGYLSATGFRQLDYSQLLPWNILIRGGPMEITGWAAIYCVIIGLFVPALRILAEVGFLVMLMFIVYWIIYWLMKRAGTA